MSKLYGLVSKEPRKTVFFDMVNKSRLGIGRKTALSMYKDVNPAGNANVLSSTLVNLYSAMPPSLRVVF
jgi:hypothetical protein